ncbi:uncharacterized [Tachysurus ichikawai]
MAADPDMAAAHTTVWVDPLTKGNGVIRDLDHHYHRLEYLFHPAAPKQIRLHPLRLRLRDRIRSGRRREIRRTRGTSNTSISNPISHV